MLRYLLPLGLFLILAAFLYVGLSLNPRDIGSTRLDKPAPSFTLAKLNDANKTFSNQDFNGKVSLFNVWASWCVTCRYEHSLLMYLARQGYVVYGLNYKDTREKAQEVLTRTGNPYAANAFDKKGQVGMDWGVTGTPETFIVDKQGIVRYKRTGQLTEEIWLKEIKPLIQELEKT
ncbi:DsbE family thiol:disulfide interchange protein [Candidatus Parabeggiatoa sp. HSG14]|uniref:DsbE family thiol:disulfide interchange protein n=1 Tax=Candidatus Parabeggiatoa sp. HSG14 TaxID=3055593 RepID=UPI0025A72187|nr:DsbE family thiol:disulfide interchange protein [Thiotrichales bacterium HSG14]